MAIFVHNKRQIYRRFLPCLVGIILISIFPLLVSIIGAYLSELFTGNPCDNEANCAWMAFSWYLLKSIPLGLVLYTILLIVAIIDYIIYLRKLKS